MILLPAVDILDGTCVRLYKGEYSTARRVAADPFETVKGFEKAGAEYIHTVDLDGAKKGSRVNADLLCRMAAAVDVPLELGGGIRDMSAVDFYLTHGISRVILGSAALKDKEFLRRAVGTYGERIAVGIDAKNGKVSTEGWLETGETDYLDFASEMERMGVQNIIFTDISRDGTLSGPNTEMLAALQARVGVRITASGGVKDLEDIRALMDMKLYGAIAGRALYDGSLALESAVRLTKEGR